MRNLEGLPIKEQEQIRAILSGAALPPLHSDIIAKRIFNPDVHPDRLNFLMRGISKDDTIDVASSAGNESIKQSLHSKSMITDIPSWLKDRRISDVEIQKVKQDFIFTRVELYASEMLLLQYSVTEGQTKSDLDYTAVKEAVIIVLMAESPKAFKEYDKACDKYIHRFIRMTADTGLSYPTKAKMIYVQLDKCLEQFTQERNAEAEDDKPDELQLWLSMIADVNDVKVSEEAEKNVKLLDIRAEALAMAQDKEVQNMLIQEKFDRMDWVTYGNEQMREGLSQGLSQGLSTGKILGTIETMRDDGKSDREIAERLMTKYGLSQEKADEYVIGSVPA